MERQGLVHLIMGDGAGKTTAAFGLVLRFCAYHKKALVIQFLKCIPSGECISLQTVPGVDVLITGRSTKFYSDMTEKERELEGNSAEAALKLVQNKMEKDVYQMIVLDEVGGALQNGMLTQADILSIIQARQQGTELVLTGQAFPDAIMEQADYISEIRCVRHPYQQGVPARRGIEY